MSQTAPANRYPESARDFPEVAEVAQLSGLEYMRRIRDGRFPAAPMARALDFWVDEVEEGRVTFRGRPRFDHLNPLGTVHGGWYGAILDSCMGCAVHSTLPAGRSYTTLEFKVNLLRGAEIDAELLAIGEIVRVGRRAGTAEGRIVGARDGRVYATGSTTCLVFELG